MSVSLDVSGVADSKPSCVHLMPCTISQDGQANVNKYLISSVRNHDENGQTATFRGRPLNGCEVKVPEGYKGVVIKETRRPFSEEEDRTFKVTHTFDSMTAWNLDHKCSKNDPIQQALDWVQVAKMIHCDDINDEKENCEEK